MTQSVFKVCALSLAVFASAIGVIRAQPYDTSAWQLLFPATEDCGAVCFMGFRPGMTTVAEAVAMLETHPWVSAIRSPPYPPPVEPQELRWIWRDGQLDYVDAQRPVVATLENGNIRVVAAADTRLTLADIWLHLGDTEQGQVNFGLNNLMMFISLAYTNGDAELRLSATTPCSANLKAFWDSEVRLILRPLNAPPARIGTPRDLLFMCRERLRG